VIRRSPSGDRKTGKGTRSHDRSLVRRCLSQPHNAGRPTLAESARTPWYGQDRTGRRPPKLKTFNSDAPELSRRAFDIWPETTGRSHPPAPVGSGCPATRLASDTPKAASSRASNLKVSAPDRGESPSARTATRQSAGRSQARGRKLKSQRRVRGNAATAAADERVASSFFRIMLGIEG